MGHLNRRHSAAIIAFMEHPVPVPPDLGELNGLAYALFLPD